jgi:hypothetical protein
VIISGSSTSSVLHELSAKAEGTITKPNKNKAYSRLSQLIFIGIMIRLVPTMAQLIYCRGLCLVPTHLKKYRKTRNRQLYRFAPTIFSKNHFIYFVGMISFY